MKIWGYRMKIHFVHTSDWHLGFAQHNKTDRFNDFGKAVNRVVDKILEIKPEFVLHTGDIFHHAKPNPGAIRHAYSILRRLKEENIPFYTIRGNHDGKNVTELLRGGNIVSLLADLDIINYIREQIIEVKGSLILGIGYHTGEVSVRHLDNILDDQNLSSLSFEERRNYFLSKINLVQDPESIFSLIMVDCIADQEQQMNKNQLTLTNYTQKNKKIDKQNNNLAKVSELTIHYYRDFKNIIQSNKDSQKYLSDKILKFFLTFSNQFFPEFRIKNLMFIIQLKT